MKKFFADYEETVTEHKIDPRLLFNADETSVRKLNDHRKAARRRGGGTVVRELDDSSLEAERRTLLLFTPAEGEALKPLVIFPTKQVPFLLHDNKEAFNIACSDKGWINGSIFKNVVERWFLPQLDEIRNKKGLQDRWALLVIDNHSSRLSLEDQAFFDEKKLKIVFLPPHSSALLQPLDLGPNLVLKQQYAKWYQPVGISDSDQRRNDQLEAIRVSLTQATCESVVRWAWQRSGLWPVNFDAISKSKMIKPQQKKIPGGIKRKRGPKLVKGQLDLGNKGLLSLHEEEKENRPAKQRKTLQNTN